MSDDTPTEPTPDEVYAGYRDQHGPMIMLRHEDRLVPGLPQRLRALAAQRGVPCVNEPAPSLAHEQVMEKMRQRGIIPAPGAEPFQPNLAKDTAREFLANLSAIAAGKLTVG
jgi:hypothetical protein